MLLYLTEFSLKYRWLVVALAVAILLLGGYVGAGLPIDVLPNLTRPRVIVITECQGMAPEEVEMRVTIPIENALNGATDVMDVRSTSDIGLSIIQVEFDWDQDIYRARQIVQERVATAAERIPPSVQPQLAPIASLLGQIMLIGMWSSDGSTDPLELRTQADWVVAQRLRALRGVAQVITMGGGRKQYQVLVDLHKLHYYEVTLDEICRALTDSNLSVTGGFVNDGAQELLVRGLGLITDTETLSKVVVRSSARRPILLEQLARIAPGPQAKRGDSSVNGKPAVVLTIQKQPDADTRQLTTDILATLETLRPSLAADIVLQPTYQQRQFIDTGVSNVIQALRSGAAIILCVLLAFLLNLRTTLITILAVPISLAVTVLVFQLLNLSINVMTLGGLAVGLGMLVDDAIVGVENAHRRLRERLAEASETTSLTIVYEAMREVLGAITISTLIVVVVFAPLFLLTGMEGRLFTPLAVAYLVSIIASTIVALTVTPALIMLLLPQALLRSASASRRAIPLGASNAGTPDGLVLRLLKGAATPLIVAGFRPIGMATIIAGTIFLLAISGVLSLRLGRDFLPAFDEGAAQVNLYTAPGTSLEAMVEISRIADQRFSQLLQTEENPTGPIIDFTCKLGRAEQDEHVMGVNVAEYVITLNPQAGISRQRMLELLTDVAEDLPGVEHEIEQPIAHLISHMLSGVAAQIAIKIHGDDLEVLRRTAEEVRAVIEPIAGIAEPFVEQQQIVPQLRFELDYDRLARYGVSAREVTDLIETAMQGRVVSQLTDGQRFFDILVRLEDEYRLDLDNLQRLPLELPDGTRILMGTLAKVHRSGGPNAIHRENARRRIVIRVNTLGRDLGSVVEEVQNTVARRVRLSEGYYLTYGGQFEAQQTAQFRIAWFSLAATLIVFAILYSTFPSLSLVLQILTAVPTAFAGGILALLLTDQTLSIAAMVGFVSLGGIATRNGLLLISTYQSMIAKFGLSTETILRGSLERLSPVLMSALTTGLGLLPLVWGGDQPGKEILYPVSTVIVGGLITSTLCEFLIRPGLFWHSQTSR